MSQPFVGEIIMFGGNFAPLNWAFCDGSLQSIADNSTLFALVGTTYGGDGQVTFALPDLRGRVPVGQGAGFVMGQMAGTETVTLTSNQIPSHTHSVLSSTNEATSSDPTGNVWAAQPGLLQYSDAASIDSNLKATAISSSGGNQPHNNLQPSLAVGFVISLFGIFPSRN